MNKKVLFAVVSVVLVFVMSFFSMTVFAAGTNDIPKENEDLEKIVTGLIPESNTDFESVTIPDATASTGSTVDPHDETEPATVAYKAGDVDGNGVVDVNDVTVFQLTLVGRQDVSAAFKKNCETVTDQKTNIIDATAIQYLIAGTFKTLPVTPDGYYSEIIRP